MKDYLQYYKKREDDDTYETKCYNIFIDKMLEISKDTDIEREDGEFLGWEKDIFDKWCDSVEAFIGCAVWRGDINLISEEYGKDSDYYYKTSNIFTDKEKQIIDEAVSFVEEKEQDLERE